jgi:hypothetical protein
MEVGTPRNGTTAFINYSMFQENILNINNFHVIKRFWTGLLMIWKPFVIL